MDAVSRWIARARGFILDVDGTLLDSHESHFRAWDRVTRLHGAPHEREEIVKHFGKTTPRIAMELFERESEDDFIKLVSREKARFFVEELPASTLFPGSIEVLECIRASGRPACLASSNYNEVIKRMIELFGLGKLVTAYTGLDDISRGKPDPEMIITSARKIKVPVEECVVVGDSIYDVQAGKAAGCKTVGVATGIFGEDDLASAGADLVLKGISDLLPYLQP